jgi:hypothetical protein
MRLLRGLTVGAATLAWMVAAGASTAIAEDTCFDVAPGLPADIRGITWSGMVTAIRQISVDEVGDELWDITFAVDRVYAHDPDRDFPKGAVLAAGQWFLLPNSTCTRHGDLGMKVGGQYLVSTAFVGDRGTAMSSLAIWAVNGEQASLVPGLYGTAVAGAEIRSVRTVDEALSLLGIEQQTETPTPSITSSQTDPAMPLRGLAALAAIAGLGAGVLLWRRRHVTLRGAE